jgi:phage-related minor tail protein
MKVFPGMASAAPQQSVLAPLISGIGAAAGAVAEIDWRSPNQIAQTNFNPNAPSITGSSYSQYNSGVNTF